jgi:hypothetical protein
VQQEVDESLRFRSTHIIIQLSLPCLTFCFVSVIVYVMSNTIALNELKYISKCHAIRNSSIVRIDLWILRT